MEPWDFFLSQETLQPQGDERMEGYGRVVSMACVGNDLSVVCKGWGGVY